MSAERALQALHNDYSYAHIKDTGRSETGWIPQEIGLHGSYSNLLEGIDIGQEFLLPLVLTFFHYKKAP